MKTKVKKKFDCVEMKRQAQRGIYEDIKGMTPQEEIAYFHEQAMTGPLANWWKRVVSKGRRANGHRR